MRTVYAKPIDSTGTAVSLKDHSEAVAEKARALAVSLSGDEKLGNLLHAAGLLHDAGKATSHIQDYFSGKIDGDPSPYHSEIGWMWIEVQKDRLKEYLKITGAIPDDFGSAEKCADILSKAVFYHHARHIIYDSKHNAVNPADALSKNCETYVKEINRSYADEAFGMKFEDDVTFESRAVPDLISAGQNTEAPRYDGLLYFVRSVLIQADHLVSGKADPVSVFPVVGIPAKPEKWDSSRYETSVGMVNTILADDGVKNHVINAPAGFGKTTVAYLFALGSKRRTVMACPTTAIARSLYKSVTELETLFGTSVGVELVYGGKRQESTVSGASCKISVGVIDTFVGTLVKGKNMGNAIEGSDLCAYDILSANAVFDEYHELLDSNALFALFVNIMSARTWIVKDAKTVIMSATPVDLKCVIPKMIIGENTRYYPEYGAFYHPQHTVKYTMDIVDSVPESLPPDTFAIFNTVREAQRHISGKDTICHHSLFCKSDRERNERSLFSHHGAFRDSEPVSVSASPIMQASVDVSAANLYESTRWFADTVQRVGRCNRWGKNDSASVHFYFSPDPTENGSRIIGSPESEKISKRIIAGWRALVREKIGNGKSETLEWLYQLYFDFCRCNPDLRAFIKACYTEGRAHLTALVPHIYKHQSDKKEISVDGLRGSAQSCCAIYCESDGAWIGAAHIRDKKDIPFAIRDYQMRGILRNQDALRNSIQRNIKAFPGIQEYVNYKGANSRLSKKKLDTLVACFESFSKNNDYPIPVPSDMARYDHRAGVIWKPENTNGV